MKIWKGYSPTIIIYNAAVHTVDKNDNIVDAIAIAGNKIMATGSNEDILTLANESTLKIDAQGGSVIPGIIDSHNHMWEAGILMSGIVTLGIDSIEKVKEMIKEKLDKMQPGQWLQGGSWIETQFKENRMPNKWDLDEVSPNNPVVLERIFSTCVANSMALKIAGITKDTPDPKGGVIDRDSRTGEPTGILQRTAKQLVRNVIDTPFGGDSFELDPRLETAILTAMDDYLTYGITSVVEPGVSPALMKAYQNIKNRGQLKIRTNLMPNWHGFAINEDENFSDRFIREYGIYSGNEDKPREAPLRLELSKLDNWVKEAHDAGWSVGIHVMGDIAIQKAVDAMYKAYLTNPVKRRHQVIHAYYPTEDSLMKMAQIGVIAALQPAFIYNEADGYASLLPKDKIESFLPMKTYIESGVTVATSTDMPSAHVNPFWGLYSAMTRKGIQGGQLGTKECITLHEGIRSMTLNGAYMTEEEEIKGSLELGKLADLVILDRNLMKINIDSIKDIQVIRTIVDGETVYQQSI